MAVSINRDRVTAHPALRSQAGHRVLGLELVAVAVVAGVAMGMIARGRHPEGDGPEDRLARLLDSVSVNLLTMPLVPVAGRIEYQRRESLPLTTLGQKIVGPDARERRDYRAPPTGPADRR